MKDLNTEQLKHLRVIDKLSLISVFKKPVNPDCGIIPAVINFSTDIKFK